MTAREYFEGARSAQRRIDGCIARIEAMRQREDVRAQRYDSIGGGGGDRDAMRMTDARIDAEARIASEIVELRSIVEDARAVCSGVRAANPANYRWGDVLELRYCECMDWHRLAGCMCVSERQAHADHDAALDWVELVGIASAREGVGQAALF